MKEDMKFYNFVSFFVIDDRVKRYDFHVFFIVKYLFILYNYN